MDGATSEMNASGKMSEIVELRSHSCAGMIAIIYQGRRRPKAIPLTDGAIVEAPRSDQRRVAPQDPEACIGITAGGVPATIHHLNLGLVVDYLRFGGVYVLPSGEVAAIYGAQAIPLG